MLAQLFLFKGRMFLLACDLIGNHDKKVLQQEHEAAGQTALTVRGVTIISQICKCVYCFKMLNFGILTVTLVCISKKWMENFTMTTLISYICFLKHRATKCPLTEQCGWQHQVCLQFKRDSKETKLDWRNRKVTRTTKMKSDFPEVYLKVCTHCCAFPVRGNQRARLSTPPPRPSISTSVPSFPVSWICFHMHMFLFCFKKLWPHNTQFLNLISKWTSNILWIQVLFCFFLR